MWYQCRSNLLMAIGFWKNEIAFARWHCYKLCLLILTTSSAVQPRLGATHQGCRKSRVPPPPTNFYRSVKPILTRGADYAHQITTFPHGFSPLPTALHTWRKQWRNEKSLNFRDRSSWSKICSKSGTGVNWLNLGRELLRSLIVEAIINECDKSNALRER